MADSSPKVLAPADAQLGITAVQVAIYGADGDHEFLCDLPVSESGNGQRHNILFPPGQGHGTVYLGVGVVELCVAQAGLADVAQHGRLPRPRPFALRVKGNGGFIESSRRWPWHASGGQQVTGVDERIA